MKDPVSLLKNLDLFQELPDEDVHLVFKACHEAVFEPGTIVFEEGVVPDRFYVLVEGRVEVWKDWGREGQDILAVKEPGSSFGEMGLIDDLPRSATIRVTERAKVLFLNKEDFRRLIHEKSSIALVLMRSVSKMVRQSNEAFIDGLRLKNAQLEKAYEDLKKAQKELLQRERLSTLGKFASMIIHDLRNPIGILKGYAEMTLLHSGEKEKTETYVRKVIAEADRLARLAGELLDYSRGEIRLNWAPVRLAELFYRLAEGISPHLKARNIQIVQDCRIPEPVLMDQDRMQRVLANLIDNARKALGRGGTITLRATAQEDLAYLEVEDTGEGMSAEVKEKMFDPFFSQSPQGGTGLGMLVVSNVVEAHDGVIEVWSEPGRGTRIRIILPHKQSE